MSKELELQQYLKHFQILYSRQEFIYIYKIPNIRSISEWTIVKCLKGLKTTKTNELLYFCKNFNNELQDHYRRVKFSK